jgi:type VI secretion system protein ImpC
MNATITKIETTLVNRLKDVGCNVPAAQIAPVETFVASKLKPFGAAITELIRSAVADSPNFRTKRLDEFLAAIIAGLKSRLSQQKSAIMGHPNFIQLERNNKSTEEVVFQKDGTGVKKRVLNVSVADLRTALADANGIPERAAFYAPVCRDEFHRPGGKPNKFIVLIEDVGPEYAELLRAVIAIGREAHAPVLGSVKPAVVCPQDPSSDTPPGSFRDLPKEPDDLMAEYRKPDNAPLHGVQSSADATHLALAVGKVIGRAPYHPVKNPAPRSEWFLDTNGPLMIPSQVLLAKSLAASFTKYKTGVRLAGVHSGGMHTRPVVVADGQVQTTEIEIDELIEMALKKCGFISYLPWKYRDFVVNFSTPTAYVPVPSGDATKDADAIVGSQLPFIMLSCQYGQLLKAKLREALGQTVDDKTIKAMLQAEFSKFVTPDVNSVEQPTLARKPLAKVLVDVKQVSPGVFHATAQIQPHMLMVGARVILTLKAEVSPAKP